METLDLGSRYVDFIKSLVRSEIKNTEIFIFGSRVQGKAKEFSDVDIALKSTEEIPLEKILLLKAKFSDSTFPYKVDIVDLSNLDKNFLNIIQPDLYKID